MDWIGSVRKGDMETRNQEKACETYRNIATSSVRVQSICVHDDLDGFEFRNGSDLPARPDVF
jgi:hypothetical protein